MGNTRFINKNILNLSPINELGNWCLTGQKGAWALQAQEGGIHGNPASGNHPCMLLPPDTVTLKRVHWKKYLPYSTLNPLTLNPRIIGQEGWKQESTTIHRKVSCRILVSSQWSTKISSECKWSAKINWNLTQNVCKLRGVLQAPRGHLTGHVHKWGRLLTALARD